MQTIKIKVSDNLAHKLFKILENLKEIMLFEIKIEKKDDNVDYVPKDFNQLQSKSIKLTSKHKLNEAWDGI